MIRKPHIRIALTSDCNFRCIYCRDGGEGIKVDSELGYEQIIKIIEIANKVGFSHIKFTGGEPLLREKKKGDLFKIIQHVKENLKFEDIQMVTNGFFLLDYKEEIVSSGLNSLTVSLDTADADEFKKITGINCFDKVIEGIKSIQKQGLPVVLNCVYFSGNKENALKLIDLACEMNVSIKLLDCVDFEEEGKYAPLHELYESLDHRFGNSSYVLPPGGLGTPMRKYIFNDSNILLKDASVGTNYNKKVCNECKYYPCQDAMISLRITADGKLKRCLIRDDNLVDIKSNLDNFEYETVEKKLQDSYDLLINAEYKENFWNPQHFN